MLKKNMIVYMLSVLIIALPAWALDFKPGKYEITATVEIPGMPAGMAGMPAQTTSQCLTDQEPVPASSADAQSCTISDMKTEGNTIKYTLVCDQQGAQVESKGEITYKGDSFEGVTRTHMGPSAGNMTITTKISGKRIGKCD